MILYRYTDQSADILRDFLQKIFIFKFRLKTQLEENAARLQGPYLRYAKQITCQSPL